MTKKSVDRAVLALFIVMAVLLYISTANYTGIALKTSAKYVQFLSVFIGVLAVGQLAFSVLLDRSNDKMELTQHFGRFAALVIGLVIFASVFESLGFFIPALIFIPVMSYILGYRKPVTIALTTVGVLGFVYIIFVQLLSVGLPGFNF